MAKKPVGANRKKFLAKTREQLLETKTKLLGEIDSEMRAEREGNKDEGMDTYDLASEERDREINFILSDRERVKLKQIDDALERLVKAPMASASHADWRSPRKGSRRCRFRACAGIVSRTRSARRNRSGEMMTSAIPTAK